MNDYVFTGGVAVVTGAASGIGAALAAELGRRGARLVLLDRDADRLAKVAAPLAAETVVVDLADAAAVVAAGERIRAAHPRVRLLVNNAGIALGGRFEQVTLDQYEEVVDVNFRAVVRLTHTLLPALRAEPGSHLVTVSSLFGLIAPAGQSAYAASKFAVRGFSEALRQELAGEVGVTTVHPGGIRTRIAESGPGRRRGRPGRVRAGAEGVGRAAVDPAGAGRRADRRGGRAPPAQGPDRRLGQGPRPAGPAAADRVDAGLRGRPAGRPGAGGQAGGPPVRLTAPPGRALAVRQAARRSG